MSKHHTTHCNQARSRGWTPRRRIVARTRAYESLEDRCLLAAVPVVSLDLRGQSMIGEPVDFSVTFDNQATAAPTTGFGPYIDLFMDVTGADGISPGASEPTDYDGFGPGLTASYLGAALTVIPVTIGPGGSFSHPDRNRCYRRTSGGHSSGRVCTG